MKKCNGAKKGTPQAVIDAMKISYEAGESLRAMSRLYDLNKSTIDDMAKSRKWSRPVVGTKSAEEAAARQVVPDDTLANHMIKAGILPKDKAYPHMQAVTPPRTPPATPPAGQAIPASKPPKGKIGGQKAATAPPAAQPPISEPEIRPGREADEYTGMSATPPEHSGSPPAYTGMQPPEDDPAGWKPPSASFIPTPIGDWKAEAAKRGEHVPGVSTPLEGAMLSVAVGKAIGGRRRPRPEDDMGPSEEERVRSATIMAGLRAMMGVEQFQTLNNHRDLLARVTAAFNAWFDPGSIVDTIPGAESFTDDQRIEAMDRISAAALRKLAPTEKDSLGGMLKALTDSLMRAITMQRQVVGLGTATGDMSVPPPGSAGVTVNMFANASTEDLQAAHRLIKTIDGKTAARELPQPPPPV